MGVGWLDSVYLVVRSADVFSKVVSVFRIERDFVRFGARLKQLDVNVAAVAGLDFPIEYIAHDGFSTLAWRAHA